MRLLKRGSRWIDCLALVAVAGTAIGFATFVTFAAVATESEWRGLIDAQSIAVLEHSLPRSPRHDRVDGDDASLR